MNGEQGIGDWGLGIGENEGITLSPNCKDVALLRLYTPNSFTVRQQLSNQL